MSRIHSAIASVLASICLILFAVITAHAQETVELEKGDLGKIPAISYQDEVGKPLTLDTSKAKLTALHFWATWCVPCVDEIPMVDDEQKIFPSLQIVPISLDGKNVDKVKAFFASHKVKNLPVLVDPTLKSHKAAGLKGMPGTVFINQKGDIIARADGPLDWQQADVANFIKHNLQ